MNKEPSFDTWTIIFALIALQGFVIAAWQWRQSEKQPAARYLALLSLIFSISLIEYVFYWTRFLFVFPHLMNISSGFPLLMGPLVYFYIRKLLIEQNLNKSDLFHLVPFIAFTCYLFPFYFLGTSEKLRFITEAAPAPAWNIYIPWIKCLFMLGYCIASYSLIRLAPKGVADTNKWTGWVLLAFTGYIASYLSYFILSAFPWFNTDWDYMISFSMSAFIYLIAYLGYIQPRIFAGETLSEVIIPLAKYKNSPLDPALASEITERLETLMQKEKLYQDGELRLETLSDKLGISRHILSQILNEHLRQSFSTFLNTYRVEEAKKLLLERNGNSVIKEIYYEVGFNNKVTFLNAFKKQTGCTPSQFAGVKSGKVLSD